MTCILRYVDARYLLPKREAFAAAIRDGDVEVAGEAVVLDPDASDVKQVSPPTSVCDKSVER